mmetsp:Transcript_22205/g.63688  ORF Transcript_22205/g.63688 Transcript_22205/m.63688 type:complete len:247 (-) Transcript_22205:202-942(-)
MEQRPGRGGVVSPSPGPVCGQAVRRRGHRRGPHTAIGAHAPGTERRRPLLRRHRPACRRELRDETSTHGRFAARLGAARRTRCGAPRLDASQPPRLRELHLAGGMPPEDRLLRIRVQPQRRQQPALHCPVDALKVLPLDREPREREARHLGRRLGLLRHPLWRLARPRPEARALVHHGSWLADVADGAPGTREYLGPYAEGQPQRAMYSERGVARPPGVRRALRRSHDRRRQGHGVSGYSKHGTGG